jgi:hypothetical protein
MRLFTHPDLVPLEIWHGQSPFGALFEVSKKKEYFLALQYFLSELHQGKAKTIYNSDTEKLLLAKNFNSIYVTGGLAKSFYQTLPVSALPYHLEIVENLSGLKDYDTTIDWGQTAIKVYNGEEKQIIERDLNQFPIRCSVKEKSAPDKFEQLKIKNLFQSLISTKNKNICVGLPVKLNSQLMAEPSTYFGLEGDLKKLFSDLNSVNIELMNDAILAARQVREIKKALPTKTLILTIGYGVGAALWKK